MLKRVLKIVLMNVFLFSLITILHYKLNSIYQQKCNPNILTYFFFKDSNMCTYLQSFLSLLENLVILNIEHINKNIHKFVGIYANCINTLWMI
jgi:hypothetical protein